MQINQESDIHVVTVLLEYFTFFFTDCFLEHLDLHIHVCH